MLPDSTPGPWGQFGVGVRLCATCLSRPAEGQAEPMTSPNWTVPSVTPGASAPSGGAAARASSSVSNTSIETPCVSSTAQAPRKLGAPLIIGMTSSSRPRLASAGSEMLAWITIWRAWLISLFVC